MPVESRCTSNNAAGGQGASWAMCDADALIGKLLEVRNSTKRDKKVALTENEVRGLCQAARDIIINQPVRGASSNHTALPFRPLTAVRCVVSAGVTRTRGADRDRRRYTRPVLRSAAHLRDVRLPTSCQLSLSRVRPSSLSVPRYRVPPRDPLHPPCPPATPPHRRAPPSELWRARGGEGSPLSTPRGREGEAG